MHLRLSFQILTRTLVSSSPLLGHLHLQSISKTHAHPFCTFLGRWNNLRVGNLRGALVTFLLAVVEDPDRASIKEKEFIQLTIPDCSPL